MFCYVLIEIKGRLWQSLYEIKLIRHHMIPMHTIIPLSFNRKMVRASASITRRKNAIQSITEVDISKPRKMLKKHAETTGEKLSFTGYVIACFAQAVKQNHRFNSFLKRNKLILLNDVNVSVLMEREFQGETVPEPLEALSTEWLKQVESLNHVNIFA